MEFWVNGCSFLHLSFFLLCRHHQYFIPCSVKWYNWWMMNWKGCGCGLNEVSSLICLKGQTETMGNISQDSWWPIQDSNQAVPNTSLEDQCCISLFDHVSHFTITWICFNYVHQVWGKTTPLTLILNILTVPGIQYTVLRERHTLAFQVAGNPALLTLLLWEPWDLPDLGHHHYVVSSKLT